MAQIRKASQNTDTYMRNMRIFMYVAHVYVTGHQIRDMDMHHMSTPRCTPSKE